MFKDLMFKVLYIILFEIVPMFISDQYKPIDYQYRRKPSHIRGYSKDSFKRPYKWDKRGK